MAKKGNGKGGVSITHMTVIGDTKLILGCQKAKVVLQDKEPSRMAAEMTVRKAKQLAPSKSGALRDSIRSDNNGNAFTDMHYAAVQHWGWRAHNIEPNWFLLDAARNTEYQWLEFFEDNVDEALDKMAS